MPQNSPALWKVSDSASWYNQLPAVKDFAPGDVFIHKYYGSKSHARNTRRAGMQILSWMSKSSGNSMHAGIIGKDAVIHVDESIEEGTHGIVKLYPAILWRCNDHELGSKAYSMADTLLNQLDDNVEFPFGKMKHSVMQMKFYGLDMPKYYARLAQQRGKQGTFKMFCSEFVVVCFDLAARELGQQDCFHVDPRAICPKALESLLNRHPKFDFIGRSDRTA